MTGVEAGTYKVLFDEEVIQELQEVLEHGGIPSRVEKDSLKFDPGYSFNPLQTEYRLIIPLRDFNRARRLLIDHYRYVSPSIPEDHYLNEMSSAELREVVMKDDEWGEYDQSVAMNILAQRGENIHPDHLQDRKQQHIEQKFSEKSVESSSLLMHYIFSIFIPPYGWLMGWLLGYSKVQLPDGTRKHAYSPKTRKAGRNMLLLSNIIIVSFVVRLIIKSYLSFH